MDISEQYLDTDSVRSVRSSIITNRTKDAFTIKSRAIPTLSINLDNTVVRTIVPPIENSITPEYSMYQPRLKSMQSMSSFKSRTGEILSNQNGRFNDQMSISTSIDPILQEDTSNRQSLDNSRVDDGDRQDLVLRLAQSIYSYPNSLANYPYSSKPVVSNEIPNVFVNSCDNKQSDNLRSYDKNFLLLTSAGKPVFASFGKDQEIIPYMGIITTVINYFQVHEDTNVKVITLKKTKQKFAFLNKSPIYLMAYSRKGETTNELLTQLDLLYSYVISSINERQLKRLFHKRSNFDLHNYMTTTDIENLNKLSSLLCDKLYPDFSFNALQCFIMRKSIRNCIHETIFNELQNENKYIPRGTLLYGLILSRKRSMYKLCSVIRPKGHTLHTIDLQLLFCLITHQFENREGNQELWIPICFPKFNSQGFLYSYIKFLSRHDETTGIEDTALVLISAQKDAFFKLKLFGDKLWDKLQETGLSSYLVRDQLKFKISDIPAPLVHHFIFKNKKYVQYVMPELEYQENSENSENDDSLLRYEQKLKRYYGQLYNSVVLEDGMPINKSILNYMHWEEESGRVDGDFLQEKVNMMGLVWITPHFELYLMCNNGVDDRDIVLRSAKKIITWCKKHESRLFIQEGAMF